MRKIPAALLSLALTASLTAPLASAAGTGSTLPELDGHWSQSAFERWHAYGIVEGDSRGMRPDANMTVGEFAAILSRAMGYTETVENPYADLKGTEWYAPYILQLTAAGILQGDGTNCNAEEPMNRERATVLFARALGIRPTAQPDLSGFVDGKDAADWSAGYIDAMAKDGIIQGVAAEVIADTGAYASLGGPVLERACTHAAGPYNYQNFEIDGWAYYTNNPPAGAFRGFGVTQTCFCIESLLNQMADIVGITPWEIRYRNAIRPGQELPNGQIVDNSTGLVETLEAVKPYVENNQYVGLACAMKNAGVGVGIPDTGRCRLVVEDGRLHIFAGASCIGQGLGTVLTQMVYEQTGIPRDRIVYERSNTYCAPDSGTTSGSRQTLFTGEAVRRACQDLKEAMGASGGLDALNGQEFYGEYLGKTDPLGAPVPNPVSHVAYGYATQVCILDDEGKIRQMVAAHDVGKAVNPLSIEGQIEGGVVMSMGFALTERYPLTDCRPTAKYGTLGLFRANQIPEITPIIVEKAGLNVACGAIGIGEITSIPTAPAIADAYYRYDGKFRTSLPLEGTPYSRK